MVDYFDLGKKIGLALVVLAAVSILLGSFLEYDLMPVITFGLLLLANFAVIVTSLADVATAKNSTDWKILWAILLVVFNLLGWCAYIIFGRKSRIA